MNKLVILFFFILAPLALWGCTVSSGDASGAAAAIENYYQALVAKDADLLVAHSCAEWESQARSELESFAAVETTLEDLACRTTSIESDTSAIVSCQGVISASYGAEVLTIDLAERQYQAAFEGGEWRMCGYR